MSTVGALPASLPPLSAPALDGESIRAVASGVVAVTLLALTEAVSIARALAARSGQHVDGNQEFIGQGMSNLAGAFFSGYVATGSFNRSGVNYAAGAKTPLAAMMAGVFLLLVVLLVAPWARFLPNAAMAGILFLVAWGLIDFKEIAHTVKASRSEFAIMAATFAATLFLTLEEAIIIGVLMSLSLYLARTSKPQVRERAPDPHSKKRKFTDAGNAPQCPQLRFVRIDGSLFFGATAHVREKLAAQDLARPEQKHVAIIAHGINFIDMAGAEALADEARRRRAGRRRALPHRRQGHGAGTAGGKRRPEGDRRRQPVRFQDRSHRRNLPSPGPRCLPHLQARAFSANARRRGSSRPVQPHPFIPAGAQP